MKTYSSPTLQICSLADGDKVCCARCGHAIVNVGLPWKMATIVREIPTDELVGELIVGDPAETIVRQFVCRGCGSLLDTETALQGEPFLEDTVVV